MEMETRSIPDVQIENIGSKKQPLYVIKGLIALPCWNGYYLYDDSYTLKKDKVVSSGRIDIWVDGEIAPGSNLQFATEQVNAYFHLVEHQQRIQHSILEGLKQEWPRSLANDYASWDQEDPCFPKLAELTNEFGFRDYIGPESIRIEGDVKDETAYITWHFRCRWDEEHGFDIITHKERVIEIGPEADPWKIYKDNGTFEQAQKEYTDSMRAVKPLKRKKWWRFW